MHRSLGFPAATGFPLEKSSLGVVLHLPQGHGAICHAVWQPPSEMEATRAAAYALRTRLKEEEGGSTLSTQHWFQCKMQPVKFVRNKFGPRKASPCLTYFVTGQKELGTGTGRCGMWTPSRAWPCSARCHTSPIWRSRKTAPGRCWAAGAGRWRSSSTRGAPPGGTCKAEIAAQGRATKVEQ